MGWKPESAEARMRRGTLVILVIGFLSAAAIYVTAHPPPRNPLGYEPEDTKKYVRDMELYGGKANMLAYELRKWLASMLHGRRLAFTVAFATVIAAGVFAFFAAPLPPEDDAAPTPSPPPR